MQRPTFLILTALTGSPLHGYAILAEVEKLSSSPVSLRVGTLYAALERLTQEGLIEVDSEEVVSGRLRRYYRLTATGQPALQAEADTLRTLATTARRRLAQHPRPRLAGGHL